MKSNDLGIYLYEQQNSPKNPSPFWMDWTMYNFYINGPHTFLSVGSAVINEDVLEYIIEFDDATLQKILSLLPKDLSTVLRNKVESVIADRKFPIVINFEDDVSKMRPHLYAEVKFGDMKKLDDRKYIPLVVKNVRKAE